MAHPDEHNKILLSTGDEGFATNLSQLGGYSGAVNRRPQQKAFSGKGHTLSSSSDSRKVRILHTMTLWITWSIVVSKDTITRAALKLLDDRLEQLTEEAEQLKTSLHDDHGYHDQVNPIWLLY